MGEYVIASTKSINTSPQMGDEVVHVRGDLDFSWVKNRN